MGNPVSGSQYVRRGAPGGGREGRPVHGRHALGVHAGLREARLRGGESVRMPVEVDEEGCHGK